MRGMLLLGSVLLVLATGCGKDDDDSSSGSTGGASTGGTSTGGASTGGASTGGASTGGDGGTATGGTATGGSGGGDPGGASGFDIRVPTTHSVDCGGGTYDLDDADALCTFDDGTVTGEIYVRATPTDCTVIMGALPIYDVVAEIMIDGVVTPLPGATYDFGGNHHNDSLEFDYGGKSYKYYHSSFGFGWRACQPMDCAQITEGETTDDGCTCDRTHPIVCTPIEADGTHAPLTPDGFAVCLGDSTCGA